MPTCQKKKGQRREHDHREQLACMSGRLTPHGRDEEGDEQRFKQCCQQE